MNEKANLSLSMPTRRRLLSSIAVALGTLATRSAIFAETPQETMKESPGTAANKARTSLHEDIDLKATPQRIYEVLLSTKQFTAFTGLPAEIDPKVGGAFSMFAGQIVGRNVELVPNQRIVQAWRPTHWDAGVYSVVKFDLKPRDSETTVVLDHTGFPEGDFDHLEWGWHNHYWDPLKKFLA
ncbi:MAG: SRPBCC domain-containing protein [Terriglobales bacterium]|nr:SRPBCC family protein [Terriglobales bacterium]